MEQRRGLPTTWADYEPLPPPPPLSAAQEAEVAALIEAAKLRAKPEAEAVSAAYLAEKQQAAAVEAAKVGEDPSEARDRVKREHEALQGGVVLGGTVLIHVNEAGKEIPVRADDLLSDPKFWHGKSFLSPHEPDHRGRSADAMAFLLQAQPILYDLNDQIVYRLQKQPVALEVVQGARRAC